MTQDDISQLKKEVEEQLKEISLDFDNLEQKSEIEEEI
jgi:hypothetical protein